MTARLCRVDSLRRPRSGPSGTEYLGSGSAQPANAAPTVSISASGAFSGSRNNGAYRDTISGVFSGKSAKAEFKETIRHCSGDKPDIYRFTMKAK